MWGMKSTSELIAANTSLAMSVENGNECVWQTGYWPLSPSSVNPLTSRGIPSRMMVVMGLSSNVCTQFRCTEQETSRYAM